MRLWRFFLFPFILSATFLLAQNHLLRPSGFCHASYPATTFVSPSPLTLVQDKRALPNSDRVVRPTSNLTPGIWKYKVTDVQPDGTYVVTLSLTLKDGGDVWIVTTNWPPSRYTPGPVTDVQTIDKSTLLLRKESLDHFAKPGQPWKPVLIDLDFRGNRASGTLKFENGEAREFGRDLAGPASAGNAGFAATIGGLPLADGYSTTLRNFDIGRVAVNPQGPEVEKLVRLKVAGTERVTVPAGTFDAYRIEVVSADGGSDKRTVWIAKDLRLLVKSAASYTVGRGTITSTLELVP